MSKSRLSARIPEGANYAEVSFDPKKGILALREYYGSPAYDHCLRFPLVDGKKIQWVQCSTLQTSPSVGSVPPAKSSARSGSARFRGVK